jgi:DNA-binding beta-propeller fold protein YncE
MAMRPGHAAAPWAACGAAWCLLTCLPGLWSLPLRARAVVDTLRSTGGIPPFLVGEFEDAAGFAFRPDGTALVFDRRRHRVYAIDAARTTVTPIVEIGSETGRVLRPTAFDVADTGDFIVADAPGRQPRVSIFEASGRALNTFTVPARESPRVTADNLVLDGIAAARYTGTTVLLNQPERGVLVAEYSVTGAVQRQYGVLRRTGFETDPDVHLAFNAALPIPAPDGGVYVVFLAGPPAFRKYTAGGTLEFERVIQGREIDAVTMRMPTQWPRRRVDDVSYPLVLPSVRSAAVDRAGRLWVAMPTSHVYVFDRDGEKMRTLQLVGAGPLTPTSMWFARDGRLLVTPGLYEFTPATD